MLPFAEELNAESIHVQSPSAVILVCGGQYKGVNSDPPLSIRDAFLKIAHSTVLRDKELVQAEDITKLAFFGEYYHDILQFEVEFAQIMDLILLFCESEGSLAELGSFSVFDEIASRLLVVVRDHHWKEDSFVKLGPLRSLERKHGPSSVFVLDDEDIGMGRGSAAHIDLEVLRDRLGRPIEERLKSTREPKTFSAEREGHVIRLAVWLVQEYGGLTIEEIRSMLSKFGVDRDERTIGGYLLCAEAANWLIKTRKGTVTYYAARSLSDAAVVKTVGSRKFGDKIRRRAEIRDYWKATDALRFRAINEAAGAS